MREGDRVCTVARDGAKTAGVQRGETFFAVPVWIGAIYEVKAHTRTGVLTYRRVGSFGESRAGFHPSKSYVAELKEAAPHPWRDGVRNGDKV